MILQKGGPILLQTDTIADLLRNSLEDLARLTVDEVEAE